MQDGEFLGVADVDGAGEPFRGIHHPDQSLDQIVHITEGAGLRTVAVDGDIFPLQGLYDKVADDSSVMNRHPRAVGIEDPDDLHIHMVLAMVIHHQAFGGPLPLVVAASDPDRVDAAPVALLLRMDLRIAVDLRCGGLEDPGLHPLGQPQRVDGAHDAGLDRLDRVVLVMNGGCRTGQVVDLIDFEVDRVDDVVTDAFKMGISQQMADVVLAAGVKIIEAKELLSLCEKPLAEVRSEKAGAAGDQNPFHVVYPSKEKMNQLDACIRCMPLSGGLCFSGISPVTLL